MGRHVIQALLDACCVAVQKLDLGAEIPSKAAQCLTRYVYTIILYKKLTIKSL